MTDSTTPRYGRRKVTGMIANVDALRQVIRAEGTPAVQSAWDAVEEHQDAAYKWAGERDEVMAAARKCADDLAAEIDAKYGIGTAPPEAFNPATMRQHSRDMEPVVRLRAALAKLEGKP